MNDAPDTPDTGVVLVGNQRLLYERLVDRDASGELGAMYRGALIVLSNQDNPDRLAQAANSVREMMEKVAHIDFGDKDGGRMGEHADVLKTIWNGYKESAWPSLNELPGQPVGPPLIRVLRQVDRFVSWIERNRMTRRAQAQRVLEHLKVSGFTMPPEQHRENVASWMTLRNFFDDATHHREKTMPIFMDRLAELEDFLLNLWMPDTAGDFEEIDQITGGSHAE